MVDGRPNRRKLGVLGNILRMKSFNLLQIVFRKKGMDHMVGKGWRDLFDVIITQARKPSFYHQQSSRFV